MESRFGTYGQKKKSISNPVTVLITVSACLGCWFLGYMESTGLPLEPRANATPLWRSICTLFAGKEIPVYLIGCGLLFFTSFLIQRGSYLLLVIKGKTLLPFLFFLLLGSTNAYFSPLQPASFALLLLLAAVYELFHSYQQPMNVGRIFNIYMYLAVGSLCWVYLLWFIPLFWYGLYKFRQLTVRSFFASLLGVFTTYWFVLAWCVMTHDYSSLILPAKSIVHFDLIFLHDEIQIERMILLFVILLILTAIVFFKKYDNTLRTRQYLSFLLTFSIYSFLPVLLYGQDIANTLEVFYLPTSILMAHFLSNKSDNFSYFIYYGMLFLFVVLFVLSIWNI